MDFPCEDFFADDTVNSGPVVDKAEAARASYKPRICSSVAMSDLAGDENFVKMSADYHYLLKDFTKAKILYKQVLEFPGISRSAAVRRDVVEGLARSCLQLGDLEEAKEYSDNLYSSVPTNTDHMTVSVNLQFEIASAFKDEVKKEYWLRRIIELHPLAPRYWMFLAKMFKKKGGRKECFCCLVRANELLRAVEKSVGSFAKEDNSKMKVSVKESMDNLGTLDRTEAEVGTDIGVAMSYAEVKVAMTRDIFGPGEVTESGDFEDLGRSARLKKMEEEFSEKENDAKREENYEEFIARFNQKWFSS